MYYCRCSNHLFYAWGSFVCVLFSCDPGIAGRRRYLFYLVCAWAIQAVLFQTFKRVFRNCLHARETILATKLVAMTERVFSSCEVLEQNLLKCDNVGIRWLSFGLFFVWFHGERFYGLWWNLFLYITQLGIYLSGWFSSAGINSEVKKITLY